MKTNIRVTMMLSVLAVVLSVVTAASAQRVLGGYKEIPKTDPAAVEAADFAVKAQSEKIEIEIQRGDLVKAERQPVYGANFRLCMQVIANEDEPYFIQTIVNIDIKGNHKLLSWADSDCGGVAEPATKGSAASMAHAADNFKPVDKNDAGAGLAADFAVKEHSKKTKMNYTLGEVVKAEDQEPRLFYRNFRLCLKVNDGDKAFFARVIVNVDQYSNHKLISWVSSKCGEAESVVFKPDKNYKAVAIDDPGADLAAQNAVRLHAAKTKTEITFGEMIKVEDKEPMLGARDFKLCMSVINNGKPGRAEALVSMDQYSNFKLTSWADTRCGESADGFTTVANTDAGIGLAADFAVKEHSKTTKIQHTVAGILKAEEKGMFSMTYRVCMKVSEGDDTHVIQAVVTMDQYSNMKLVSWEHSKCGN